MPEEVEQDGKPNGKDKSTAVAIRGETGMSVTDIKTMAAACYTSGMFKDLKSEAQAMIKIAAGSELGLGAIYSMQKLYMVDGKLGMAAETMGALIKRGNKYDYRLAEHTDDKCTIIFYQRGAKEWQEVYRSTFTMADARRANLVKPGSGWVKYPRALLFSRTLSQGARIVCPDAIGGGYTLEELESIGKGETVEGEFKELPNAPVAESKNVRPGMSAPKTDAETGEVEETATPYDDNPYRKLLDACPEHDDAWYPDNWGKLEHKVQGGGWCKFRDQVKPILKSLGERAGFTDNKSFTQWVKDNYDGATWAKLSEEQQVDAFWRLEKLAKEKNPVVQAAMKAGGVVTSTKQESLCPSCGQMASTENNQDSTCPECGAALKWEDGAAFIPVPEVSEEADPTVPPGVTVE